MLEQLQLADSASTLLEQEANYYKEETERMHSRLLLLGEEIALTPATLLFGLDANVYFSPGAKQQGLDGFATEYGSLGYSSSWGDDVRAVGYTSYCARTFLQPQLQKAVRVAEKKSKGALSLDA